MYRLSLELLSPRSITDLLFARLMLRLTGILQTFFSFYHLFQFLFSFIYFILFYFL